MKIHHNDSGYFLWLELPEPLDAGELSPAALTHHISIAPGKMFSTGENWSRFSVLIPRGSGENVKNRRLNN